MRWKAVPLQCEANQLSKIILISEKPTAAKRIAQALDDNGTPNEVKKRGASYYESTRNGDNLIVVYALGHLFELRQTEKGWKYPRLSAEWVPKYEVDKKATGIKPIIRLILRESHRSPHEKNGNDETLNWPGQAPLGYRRIYYLISNSCNSHPID